MANLRLPTLALAVVSLACSCSFGPVVASSVKGRVLDKRTEGPIPGATVFYSYTYGRISSNPHGGGAGVMCVRWTTTDAAGAFYFASSPCSKFPPVSTYSDEPLKITVLDLDYGLFGEDFSDSHN